MDLEADSDEFTLRAARPEDWPQINGLLKVSWHDSYDAIMGPTKVERILRSLAGLEHVIGHEANYGLTAFLLAACDERIAGMAVMHRRWIRKRHFISMLYVHPNVQGRGLGQALLHRVFELAPDATCVRLAVLPENTPAIRYYERNGFQRRRIRFDTLTWQRVVVMDLERRAAATNE